MTGTAEEPIRLPEGAEIVLRNVPGITWDGINKDRAFQSLDKMARSREGLTAPRLLRAAERDSHPLHDMFTWDDTEAAKKCRLGEARKIVQGVRISYRIEEITHKGKSIEGRYFESVVVLSGEATRRYVPILTGDFQTDRAALRAEAQKALERWRRRYDSVICGISVEWKE